MFSASLISTVFGIDDEGRDVGDAEQHPISIMKKRSPSSEVSSLDFSRKMKCFVQQSESSNCANEKSPLLYSTDDKSSYGFLGENV